MKIAQVRMFGSETLGKTQDKINAFLLENSGIIKVNSFTQIDQELFFCVMVSFEIDKDKINLIWEAK